MYTRNERIVPVYVEDEMRDSYLSYAMSVIVGRALPDARDGLKPVHRRILYAMRDLGLEHNKPYKKCARITGDTLGRYHPHGDIAVYDALVRMAQDFSLRYPLIDGQGNFGCFTKDTKIRLTDGRNLTFVELIKENKQGKKNYTFTFNLEKQRIEIAEIRNPRLTRKNAEIIKVILDDGQEIKCTLDHLFMLRDGTYKKARDLKSQDSLMPLYTKLYDGKDDLNLKEYETIYQALQNNWEFIHHLADEWNLKNKIYEKSAGKIRHHKDFNKLNNNPDNIEKITPELYEKERISGLPKIDTALRYFSDFEDLITQAQARQKYNHKVVAIEVLDKKEDVYDLTIEPWHNFALAAGVFVHNSIDGDAPAAMRYTECRLAPISDEMLADIEKETVDFIPNFDETLWEPTVLPACLPNLLVNGSSGIAVGMATNIPPHNLTEVIDAISLTIDNPDCSIEELMKIIKGPDFPTRGIICGRDGIKEAYRTGKGLLKLRAKASIETLNSGKEQIVVTELPYQVNKASLIESIANLVQDKRIEGISDLRDESDKEGIRIVVELKRDQEAEIVLNQLFKHTQMETTFGVIMLALVEGRPRVLDLKQAINVYIGHRKEIITRRTRFELNKAQNRAHILEGLKKALAHLDEVIKTIKKSKSVPEAKESLIKGFDLSPEQAQAILEMQLQRLTHLERDKIDEEYLDLIKRIELHKSILDSEKKVSGIIEEELLDLKKKFADERRTKIAGEAAELEVEDLIAEEDVVITISHSGYIKRLPVSSYRKQYRGGKGVTGMETREEDFVEHLFIASTHDYILIFTDKGKLYWLKVHEIPIGSRTTKGKAMVNLLQLSSEESISSLVPVRKFEEEKFLVMATRQGLIKKTELTAFSNPRKAGIIAITLEGQDELIEAELTDGKQELLLATKLGKAIRFRESQVRDMGRTAKGVKGITLSYNDRVIAMKAVRPKSTLLTVTSEGFGKRTPVESYRLQNRGGKGIINVKVTKRNGEAVGAKVVSDTDELMVITFGGMIVRCAIKDIRTTGRNAQGVKIIKLDPKDKVASFARVVAEAKEE